MLNDVEKGENQVGLFVAEEARKGWRGEPRKKNRISYRESQETCIPGEPFVVGELGVHCKLTLRERMRHASIKK